jgi:hypothetical protein
MTGARSEPLRRRSIAMDKNTAPSVEPKKVTPEMERPSQELRLRTGLRAGRRRAEGGVTHTDTWRDG